MDRQERARSIASDANWHTDQWNYQVPIMHFKTWWAKLFVAEHEILVTALGVAVGVSVGLLVTLHLVPVGLAAHVGGLVAAAIILATVTGAGVGWGFHKIRSLLRYRLGFTSSTSAGNAVVEALEASYRDLLPYASKTSRKIAHGHVRDVMHLVKDEHTLALKISSLLGEQCYGPAASRTEAARLRLRGNDLAAFEGLETQRQATLVEAARIAVVVDELREAETLTYEVRSRTEKAPNTSGVDAVVVARKIDTQGTDDHIESLRELRSAYAEIHREARLDER